ncbi:MAG: pyridoxal-phosphate dependent enzyme [Myxococcota bacterium]
MAWSEGFERFGGRYVAEALYGPLEAVATALDAALEDDAFLSEFERWLDHRIGRPTPLSRMRRLSQELGGGQLWLKREDLCQGGSFTACMAIFQALLAKYMNRSVLVAESGSGDFGVALSQAGAALGLEVHVFMTREDILSEPLAVAEIKRFDAHVVSVDAPSRGRADAAAEAMRVWMSQWEQALYCSSMLAAPDPYPRMLAHAAGIIGAEARVQLHRRAARVDYIIAPVGTGSLAAGLFAEFIDDDAVHSIGVQAGGEAQSGRHAASLLSGRPGIAHGTRSFLLQDDDGQILGAYSIAGGLISPIVGPQHAAWAQRGQALYVSMADHEAIEAVERLMALEGVHVSLETGHALAYALKLLPTLAPEQSILLGVSGQGTRDAARLAEAAKSGRGEP